MLALAVIIPTACLLAALFYWGVLRRDITSTTHTDSLNAKDLAELQSFEQQILQDSLHHAQSHGYAHHSEVFSTPQGELFPFNPNTADSATLVRLGLRPWQAHNCRQYVRKGGRWRSPEHFSRLYGLSAEEFERLRAYIVIAPDSMDILRQNRQKARETQQVAWERRRDSLRALYPEKLPAGSVVDLNQADTLLLRRIPQIGQWRAKQIAEYRERLGGFVSTSQLREINGMPASVVEWFNIDKQFSPKKINVNKATFQQLVRHPYLNYEQVKVIMQHRRVHGSLHSWRDVKLSPEFSDNDFQRLAPYFSF